MRLLNKCIHNERNILKSQYGKHKFILIKVSFNFYLIGLRLEYNTEADHLVGTSATITSATRLHKQAI